MAGDNQYHLAQEREVGTISSSISRQGLHRRGVGLAVADYQIDGWLRPLEPTVQYGRGQEASMEIGKGATPRSDVTRLARFNNTVVQVRVFSHPLAFSARSWIPNA